MSVVAFLVMLASAVTAEAGTISGTISNTSGRTGRVYMYLQQQFGGDTGIGVSIAPTDPGWPNFTIRGVPNGGYYLKAFVDGSGTGRLHANDPTWSSSGTIDINNSSYSGPNSAVSFNSHPNVPVQPSGGAMILPGNNGAFVGWDGPRDNNGNTIADAYRVYYSTSNSNPKAGGTYVTAPAGDQAFAVFHISNGTPLYVQVTALVGATESAATSVASTTINPPESGFSISGTINLSGISNPTGSLYIALIDRAKDGGGPVAVAHVASPPQLSNSFTINTNSAMVPNGDYALFALIDSNSDGKIASGDVMPDERTAPKVTITGSNITLGSPVTLTKSNSSSFLSTMHSQDSSTPPNDGYQVIIGAQSMAETLTNITVTGGPGNNGLIYPIDLGINNWGSFQSWFYLNGNRPKLTDVYNLSIQYVNGAIGPDTVSLPVTAVLDSFATPIAPQGYFTSPLPDTVNYSWTAPTNPPTPYTYSFWVNAPGFNNNDAYSNMPSSTLLVPVSGLTYNNGTRNDWTISVQDSFGNQAQKMAWLTYTTAPAISSFTPTSADPGTTVTINGVNFDATPANNTVKFNGTTATVTAASSTQLTVTVPVGATSGQISVENSSGTGFSAPLFFTVTLPVDTQPPTVPTNVTATAVGPTQINVNWNSSTDNIGVTYYQVYRNGNPAGTPYGPNNTYWPDTFVAPNTTYTYTVAACDGSGNCSAPSAPAQATTPGITTAPGAPTNISITPWDGEATVSFSAPISDGGSPILGYTVTTNPAVTPVSKAGSPITINGLTNNQLYTISVTAYNAAGTGPAATITTTPYFAPFRIGTTGYPTLQTAYADTPSGGTFKAKSGPVVLSPSTLTLATDKTTTFAGGYDAAYNSDTRTFTTLSGKLNIQAGKAIMELIKIN